MSDIVWPTYVKFDDTQADINEARRVWIDQRSKLPGGSTAADFLDFMQAYARELERRRQQQPSAQESA